MKGPTVIFSDLANTRPLRSQILREVELEGLKVHELLTFSNASTARWAQLSEMRTPQPETENRHPSEWRSGGAIGLSKWLRWIFPGLSPLDSLALILRYRLLLFAHMRGNHVAALLAWHQFNPFHYMLKQKALRKGTPLVWLENGSLPGTLAVDTGGQMGLSWPSQHPSLFKSMPLSKKDLEHADLFIKTMVREAKTNKVQEKLKNGEALQLKKHASVVLFLGSNDARSQAAYPGAPQTGSAMDLSSSTLGLLQKICKELGFFLVAKAHPLFPRPLISGELSENNIGWLSESADVWECVLGSDVIVTNYSGAAVIGLVLGKTVVVPSMHHFAKISPAIIADTELQLNSALSNHLLTQLTSQNEIALFVARFLKYQPFANVVGESTLPFRCPTELSKELACLLREERLDEESLLLKITPDLNSGEWAE